MLNISNVRIKEEESGSRLFKITCNIHVYKQATNYYNFFILYCQAIYYKHQKEN